MKAIKNALIFCVIALTIIVATIFSTAAINLKISGFKMVGKTETTVTLQWNETKGARGYKVFFVEKDGRMTPFKYLKKTRFTVKELKPDTDYRFAVRPYVFKENGKRDFGETSDFVSVHTRVPTPSKPSMTALGRTAIHIKWKAVKNAEGYRVFLKKQGEAEYSLYSTVKTTTAKINNLSPATFYKIKLVALRSRYTSERSLPFEFYTIPSNIQNLSASAKGREITLKWAKRNSNVIYAVYATDVKGAEPKFIKKISDSSFTYTASDFGKTYYFKIVPLVEKNGFKVKGNPSQISAKSENFTVSIVGSSSARKGEYLHLSVPDVKSSSVTWSSSNPNVVKIVDGNLFANGTGSCTITASSGGKSAKKTIRISAPVTNYRACMFDVTDGKYVFQNRGAERCYPGSTTKLITALVAVKYCSLDTVMTVGGEIGLLEGMASRCNISRGEKFYLKDLLYGMLLPSGCDAAYTIAVSVARKVSGNSSMSSSAAANYFVGLMNSYLKEIGCTGSHMVNPHGYPYNNHYTTAYDMVKVARKILENSTLSTITSTHYKYVTAITGRGRGWSTTNSLINPNSGYYYRYAVGLKTGTVNNGYTNVMSAVKKHGRTYITVVFGCESFPARYEATWKMYNAYLTNI